MSQSEQTTPMMRQYLSIKEQHKDQVLLFRMGDFYELFFEDALLAANILGIALTKRGDVPMCGIPYHALENYLPKLTDENLKIAICEQLESPEEAKKREGYKAVVRRDVVRIITPGTIVEESLLDDKAPNYLAAIVQNKNHFGICFIDLSTRAVYVTEADKATLSAELAKISPKEILLSEKTQLDSELTYIFAEYRSKIVYQVDSNFDYAKCKKRTCDLYKIASTEIFGTISKAGVAAIGAVLEYLSITQKANIPDLPFPRIINQSEYMQIDAGTRRNLEIVKTLGGNYKNSLLSIIDNCVTKPGSRLLYDYISNPLAQVSKIRDRLDITEYFYNNQNLTEKIRAILKQISDIERALSRIAMRRAFPRDLLAIKYAISFALQLKELLFVEQTDWYQDLPCDQEILTIIDDAINDDAPVNCLNGGVVKLSYHPKVAELSELINESSKLIEKLQTNYRIETGIDNLKISNNNIFGFFVEVSAKSSSRILSDKFIHKQTMSNAVRYITTELKELESSIINANAFLVSLEQEIFADICSKIMYKAEILSVMSRNLSEIDVACSFAKISYERSYVKPEMLDSLELEIKGGRHPIVELSLKASGKAFVSNDCRFSDEQKILLITGPNMAGKSTFLRQNAIIIIMAQIGCFVPAASAKIGVVDKLFSRIGAADDLSKGQSTFMVEMIETSAILLQSTQRSLIILDEVGRGTSTYDGVSIAWSVLEYMHNQIGARALFATHYHELVELEKMLPNLQNYTIKISEHNGKVIFMHKIIPGAADKSYGIHVAELAGLPKMVTRRAKQILQKLEKDYGDFKLSDHNMSLFDYAQNKVDANEDLLLLKEKLDKINPDSLSPKEALEILYKLKTRVLD
jgi:DNA mismatch repair protein MutS